MHKAETFNELHGRIVKNLPNCFKTAICFGSLGFVVPHTIYPTAYHCKQSDLLPFAGLASQKSSINCYQTGI